MKIHPVGAELFHADGQMERQAGSQAGSQAGGHDELNCQFFQYYEGA